ncbi:MAG TPA: hypothetical protein VJI15_05555 [Candidatus Nanoarchaeia archaeon]|nr:hypothetical protein [Candidatus Nanoarchaeia archaeon]
MGVKEIRQEVERLPSILENIRHVHDSLLQPLKSSSHPYQSSLSFAHRQELNRQLGLLKKSLEELEGAEQISHKLRNQASHLVELKLTSFNGDKNKAALLEGNMLHDEYFNIQQTIKDIQDFEQKVDGIQERYGHINQLLNSHLSLEHSISYADLPHKIHLQKLQKTIQKEKELVHSLGKEFLVLAKR